jgi:hypothetical protein
MFDEKEVRSAVEWWRKAGVGDIDVEKIDLLCAVAEAWLQAGSGLPEVKRFNHLPVLTEVSSKDLHAEYAYREGCNITLDACRAVIAKNYVSHEELEKRFKLVEKELNDWLVEHDGNFGYVTQGYCEDLTRAIRKKVLGKDNKWCEPRHTQTNS